MHAFLVASNLTSSHRRTATGAISRAHTLSTSCKIRGNAAANAILLTVAVYAYCVTWGGHTRTGSSERTPLPTLCSSAIGAFCMFLHRCSAVMSTAVQTSPPIYSKSRRRHAWVYKIKRLVCTSVRNCWAASVPHHVLHSSCCGYPLHKFGRRVSARGRRHSTETRPQIHR